jgi:uncharacterized membrane protein
VELQLSVIESGVIAMSVKCHLFLSAQSRVFAKWALLNGDIAISPFNIYNIWQSFAGLESTV